VDNQGRVIMQPLTQDVRKLKGIIHSSRRRAHRSARSLRQSRPVTRSREGPRYQRPGSLPRRGLVLCELVWVLSRLYRQTKPQIVGCLEQILNASQFTIEHDPLVRTALGRWRSGKGDFSDHVIGEIGLNAGCRDMVTLDRDLRHTAGFTVIA
jgi:predicted nucleic-acid-binding protein